MSKDSYNIYQNILVTTTEFYDIKGNHLPNDSTFSIYYNAQDVANGAPNIGIPNSAFDKDDNGLVCFFNKTLNFNEQPYEIEIKNINTSLTSSSGYLFELSANFLDFPIHFLDSTSTGVNYVQPVKFAGNKTLPQGNVKFTLKRVSGTNPLPLADAGLQEPYLINPALSFTIVYKYFSTK